MRLIYPEGQNPTSDSVHGSYSKLWCGTETLLQAEAIWGSVLAAALAVHSSRVVHMVYI